MDNPSQLEFIIEEDARCVLAKHQDALQRCVRDAFSSWASLMNLMPEMGFIGSKRLRANWVYDFIRHKITAEFQGRQKEGLVITEKPGFVLLTIEDRITLRFKKINRKMKSSNIMTHQQLQLQCQEPLPGMPNKATVLTVGYQLDALEAAVKDVLVTFQLGGKVVWFFSIDGAMNVTIPLPATLVEPIARPKVKAKKGGNPEGVIASNNK